MPIDTPSQTASGEPRQWWMVFLFLGFSLFFYVMESTRLHAAIDERTVLLKVRDQGVTTPGTFAKDQVMQWSLYRSDGVLSGAPHVSFVVNGEEHTTRCDHGGIGSEYCVRYLPSNPHTSFCWEGADSLEPINSAIWDKTARIALYSVVILVPGVLGLLLLIALLFSK